MNADEDVKSEEGYFSEEFLHYVEDQRKSGIIRRKRTNVLRELNWVMYERKRKG